MKVAPRTYRTEWDLHAWVGVVTSLALFVMFFCGVFALYRYDIGVWQERMPYADPPEDVGWGALLAEAAPPPGASVGFSRPVGSALIEVTVWADSETHWLHDPTTGARTDTRSHLADELYHLHFLERLPYGTQLSGLVSIALVAITLSGVVVHLKDLPKHLWRFRPELALRASAADAHKVVGLFTVPFAIVFGWSGALLGFWGWQTDAWSALTFDGDTARVEDLRGYPHVDRVAAGRSATALPLDELVDRAGEAIGAEGEAEFVDIQLVGDENAWAGIFWANEGLTPRRWARIDAVTGEVFTTSATASTPANEVEKVLFDLHYAHFGGRVVQLVYALLSLAMAGVILTGTIVWVERRDPRRVRLGNRLLERANAGVPCGLVLGVAAAFLANRIAPEGEIAALYGAWLLAAAAAFLPVAPRRYVTVALALAAAGFAAVVLLGIAEPANLLTADPRSGVFATEVLLLVLAAACAVFAYTIRPASVVEAAA